MKKLLVFLLIVGWTSIALAQNFQKVLPGEQFLNTGNDTLIVFTYQQAKKALATKKKLDIADSLVLIQGYKIENYEQQVKLRDEKNELMIEVIKSHERVQDACEEHAHEMKKEARRQARHKMYALIGGGIAVVLVILL